ncbi:Ig-like domain-containing protein [Pontibacter burrus]|uniref:T9SS type B sorting domain-containing protein n=1 Tax=Pontibacter burrus TaxID=2704466 RepID=A0A6B3LW46_9BACT|nr:Ig-like domain-containing protein [Pontibacter burrus]NEM99185.1 T9SS type B sorting domain-containing protein [Pontibacter burrus]
MAHPYLIRWQYLLVLLSLISVVTAHANKSAGSGIVYPGRVLDVPRLTANPSMAGTIYLTWTNAGATQYTVEYSKLPGAPFTTLATLSGSATTFRHSSLGYSETLHYRIKATNGSATVYSNTVTATTHPANYTYRIMPLGDSNTDGGSGAIPRNDRVGYRNELYRLLRSGSFSVDMVGSEVSGSNSVTAFRRQNGYDPDLNHAGFGGAKNFEIVTLLQSGKNGGGPYLDQYNPDIVLLHIGTNSLGYSQNITELEGILNEIDAYERRSGREVTVVLARIIKQCTDCGANQGDVDWDNVNTADYNRRMSTMAARRQAAGDRLVLVDMSEDAGIIYSMHADMEDYLHPNASGFAKMAQIWFGAVKALLTPTDTHAPETQITAVPETLTNNRSATFRFASNELGVTYQASLNGAAFTDVSNPVTFQNISDGRHTLRVRAVDAAGNTDATPASFTWTIDATPPKPPVIVAVSEDRGPVADDGITSDNTLQLKGTAEAEATIAVTRVGTGVIGTTRASATGAWIFSYENTALQDGSYSFTAAAADSLGNTSPASERFAVTIDQKAPTATIATTATSPINKAFQIQISFSEAVYGLQASDFKLSNGTLSNLQQKDQANYTATVTPTTDGNISVQLLAAKLTDLAGNANQISNTLQFIVDITRPTVTIASEAAAIVNTDFDVTITFSEAANGFAREDITVENGSIASFRKVDDANYAATVKATGQGKVSITIVADVATDAASNGNEPSNTLTRTFDSVAPAGYAVAFTVQQVNVTNQNQVGLTISGGESGATYNYSISSANGGNAVTGTGKLTGTTLTITGLNLTDLKDGILTASVNLTDEAGNRGEAATTQVEKVTRDIAAVTPSGEISVPFNTAFEALNLPLKVQVTYTSGEQEYLDVTWEPGNYNRIVAGIYMLSGNLALANKTTNFGNRKGTIQVTVEPNQSPTELTISNSTFKPDAEPVDVLATLATQDPDDDQFTYELVAGEGDTHNTYFALAGNELYLVSNKGLSGITNFSIRVRTTDQYRNSIERTFMLTKLPYDPNKITLVNAFSPDGDGINDTWVVPELRFYDKVEITVLDRSGVRLFHTTNPESGWDGRIRNGDVQAGPYYYIIQIKDIDLVKKGVLTVLK